MQKKYLISDNNCPACEVLKLRLADKIKLGKIGVINLSSERNFFLVKKLGIQFVPEVVTVSRNENGTFDIRREDGRMCRLDSWRWWKLPRSCSSRKA